MAIGTFSFLKVNMYEDLINHEEEVMSSILIRKLIDQETLEDKKQTNNIKDVKVDLSTELSLHNVVDADSSQMEAILKTLNGESLVIQGPPGTGKSQTITNIIAENMYQGKKVLFVSEKLAALNVVYNNLNKVGLGKYCLELHSNKTNKRLVLDELKQILESPKETINNKADKALAELKEDKLLLDEYALAINKKQSPINKSIFEMISDIKEYTNYYKFDFVIRNISSKDQSYFKKAIQTLKAFVKYQDTIGYDYHKNNWYGLSLRNIDYEDKIKLEENLKAFYSYLDKLEIYIELLNDDLKLKINTFDKIEYYLPFIKSISKLSLIHKNLFDKDKLKEIISLIKKYNQDKIQYDEAYFRIGEIYKLDIYENDLNQIYEDFINKYQGFFRFLNKGYKKYVNLLKGYQKDSKQRLNYNNLVELLNFGRIKQKLQIELETTNKKVLQYLEIDEKNNLNYPKLEIELNDVATNFPTNYKSLSTKNLDILNDIESRCSEFIKFYKNTDAERSIKNDLQESFSRKVLDFNNVEFDNLFERIGNAIKDFALIDHYVSFNCLIDELSFNDLLDYVNKCITNRIEKDYIIYNYAYLFYYEWVMYAVGKEKIINDSNRIKLDNEVENFKKNDINKLNISKALISQVLSSKRPNVQTAVRGSQLSDIIKEMSKKTKVKPLRLLLKDDFNIIQEIKPCFLMSPLSVSTYLTADTSNFDMVIFDEASQVFPEDAVGAIYRSKQVIIVGDSKQMPPTTFFQSTYDDVEYDEEDDDTTAGFESILDLASACFPQTQLLWHYRSQSEELIDFSNKEFYHSKLITFPESNPSRPGYGNVIYYVDKAIFDRKKHQNQKEAEKVVKVIFEQIKRYPERTLGVVAFSVAQADLIEELVNKQSISKKQELLDSVNFFVKNLETVQGDERDTIIFSTAYAPDNTGKFINNFGPLNKEGGERRLNVAVTRARCQNIIVTSLHSTDISKDVQNGGLALKNYLSYVETSNTLFASNFMEEEFDTYLIKDIRSSLERKGYQTESRVGKSEYRIDIAVKKDGKFLLAIECDGPNYYNCKTSSERNRLREQVLNKYGWYYYRIWSVDWLRNKDIEINKLIKYLDKIATKGDIEIQDEKINNDFIKTEKQEIKDIFDKINEEEKEIVFDKYVPYRVDNNGLVMKELYNLIDQEAPITFELIVKKCMNLFRRSEINDDYRKLVKNYLKKNPEQIFLVNNDYYTTDKEREIKLRVPRREKEERDVDMISIAELSAGMIVLIKNNVSIQKQNLYSALAHYIGYQRLGTNISNRFDEVLNNLLEKEIIKMNDDYIMMK